MDPLQGDSRLRAGPKLPISLLSTRRWGGYRKELDGKIADLKNIGSGPYGGAITAALYLNEFVAPPPKADAAGGDGGDDGAEAPPWLHLDLMAYNTAARPGRPEGGEAMGVRALFSLLKARFG